MAEFHSPKVIICYGDSNTHGYDAQTDGRFSEEVRWPCLLGSYLGEGFRVIEEGLSGRTAVFDDPLFEGLNGLKYLYPCMMTHEPIDLLIVMLGTNDTKERFGATPENIAKGMERLIKKAKDAADAWRGDANILVVAPPPIASGYETTRILGEMGEKCIEKSKALAPLYQDVANRLGCRFLDAGSIEGIGMNTVDYMHLTAKSHRLLAETLKEMILGVG